MLRLDVTHRDQLMQVGPADHGEDLHWRYGFTLFLGFFQNKEQLVRYTTFRSFRFGPFVSVLSFLILSLPSIGINVSIREISRKIAELTS